ncbi:MAG: recombination protein RecR [Rhodospirillaceae bacterium]|nr:MAG: recombination protein RecR [Rhodospirillaceae bacterium]
MSGSAIDHLIQLLGRLPGLGRRSARRVALDLLRHRESRLVPLVKALEEASENVRECTVCGNFDLCDPCGICADPQRDRSLLCVVEEVADLWALERAQVFHGIYHVLGGVLSALDGVGPEDLRIVNLIERAHAPELHEVILALNATVDGQTTAHYIGDRLKTHGLTVSRLAHGVPVGGELDYLDDGTLGTAVKARRPF